MAALALPVQADIIPLADLNSYLNGLQSAKAGFSQLNEDGTTSNGTVYIKRPNRARFEYDPPNKGLVIAGGQQVAIFDPKSNVPPEQYPLRRTPLSLILAETVNLDRSNLLVSHREEAELTVVTLQDPEHPEYGNIELKFSADPIVLRQWVINNEAGGQTQVALKDLQPTVIGAKSFNIPQEIQARGLN
ncbi:MAG: outer membrane lipoprotein carrier protein LolA [Pseudomonadota bacterium]